MILWMFFVFLCAHMRTAEAAERLIYPENISPHASQSLAAYTSKDSALQHRDLRIAQADLNRDGIGEYILHSKDCDTSKLKCLYYILAQTPRGIISLGTIPGKELLLGDGFSYGVRDIIAFENKLNDYEQTLYVWRPEKSSYRKKDEQP
ncbi:MAG: hypothetical protein IT559_05240 [Alphaproteobacteria bacterium]|nr:hypothetical protein [Alphaproteobacteria bacterium]